MQATLPLLRFFIAYKIKWHFFWHLTLLNCFHFYSSAQVAINADNFEYTQFFDGLSSAGNNNPWTNDQTLPGWYAASSKDQNSDNIPSYMQVYRATNNGTNSGIYSFGTGADRAFGSITTDLRGDITFGIHFENTSIVDFNSVSISFRCEHWWKSNTTIIGHQRTKLSYAVGNSLDLAPAALLDNNAFIDVPEAYLLSIDTTPADQALNGNSAFENISVIIPVSIPAGSEFFLRFYDENLSGLDIGLAVDSLYVTFSSDAASRITSNSGYEVFPYLDMGVVKDIPDTDLGETYLIPTNDQLLDWLEILENFYDDDNLDDVDASDYDYITAAFTDSFGRTYHVLRKQNYSDFFWGTFVKTVNSPSRLVIQAPHAIDDANSGRQSAAVYNISDARGLMLSGISRCASDQFSSCSGQTDACSDTDTNEPFRKSDVAHEVNSIFHLATTTLAAPNPSLVFVQLHGFDPDGDDPDLIISCGSKNARLKSVPDYAVLLREYLLDSDPSLDIKVTHVDAYDEYAGQTNVQGRYLNLYPQNICTANNDPETVTNRFLHIEQFDSYRSLPANYQKMANALIQIINDNSYVEAISIASNPFYYEDFTNLYSSTISHTWANNFHVPGWYAAATVDELFSIYHTAHGQLNHGGIYGFGPINSSDRALGSIATSASASAGDVAYGILFKNDTGITLYGIELDFDSEQWRDSDQDEVHTVELGYRVADEIDLYPEALLNNSLYTHFPDGDLKSLEAGCGLNEMDGNSNSVHIHVVIPFDLDPGQELFLRFYDVNNSGFDKALAIDNFNASFLSEPPLPIDWTYFKVSKKKGRPFLEWGSENEDECQRYVILRSTDAKNFESIATLPCKRGPLTNHYHFTDYSPLWQPNVYYKIGQYDESGEVTYSAVGSFNSAPTGKPNVYYQNGELIVDADNESKLQSVAVLDFMGRIICKDSPAIGDASYYTMNCQLPQNQLLIIQLVFDSNTYIVHMRTSE